MLIIVNRKFFRDTSESHSRQWQESGGPEVSPPTRAGFGSRLIRLELTHELHGEVELIYDPGGLKLTTSFLLSSHPGGLA